MLGRQWQFGEFNGADAGSPAAAQVIVDTAAVTRYQPGPRPAHIRQTLYSRRPGPGNAGGSGTSDRRLAPQLAARGRIGTTFTRLLDTARVGPSRAQWLASTYVPTIPSAEQAKQIDAASLSFIRVLSGRTIDGLRFAARLRALQASNSMAELFREAPLDQVAESDRPRVTGLVTNWLSWLDGLFQQGAARPPGFQNGWNTP